jgi:hypothetical protein
MKAKGLRGQGNGILKKLASGKKTLPKNASQAKAVLICVKSVVNFLFLLCLFVAIKIRGHLCNLWLPRPPKKSRHFSKNFYSLPHNDLGHFFQKIAIHKSLFHPQIFPIYRGW